MSVTLIYAMWHTLHILNTLTQSKELNNLCKVWIELIIVMHKESLDIFQVYM